MANRQNTIDTTADDHIDKRPHVPGIYRRVLPVVCLREIERGNPDEWLVASGDAEKFAKWEADAAAEAEQLADQRLASGTPIDVWWWELPGKLPPPLDTLGHDPAPRNFTISPDDRVDAGAHFHGLRKIYEQARHYPNRDHGYFQAAFALAGEFGAG